MTPRRAYAPRLVAPLALASALASLGSATPARAQTPVGWADPAQARFLSGRRHLDARNYPAALEDFRASLALVPSPNTRLYLSRTLREAGQLAEAYREFVRTADEADVRAQSEPRYAPTATAARAEAQALLPRIATLTLVFDDAPDRATLRVDAQPIERSQWGVPIAMRPGSVVIDAEAPGRASFQTRVELIAGHAARVRVQLAPQLDVGSVAGAGGAAEGFVVPRNPGASSGRIVAPATPGAIVVGASSAGPGPGVGIGVMISGAVLAAGAGGFGAATLVTYGALERDCAPREGACTVAPTNANERAATGSTMGTLFTVTAVLGGAALLTGGVIYALTRPPPAPSSSAALPRAVLRFPAVIPALELTPNGAAVAVRGVF